MKLIYLANDRLPTEKAYGINIVKTCQALAGQGVEVTILAPRGLNTSNASLFGYYGIPENFTVQEIPIIDAVSRGWKLGYFINQASFAMSVLFSRPIMRGRKHVILARDELTSFLLGLLGYSVYYDMHGFPEHKRWFWKMAMQRMKGVIVTNKWKVRQCRDLFNIEEKKIIVAPNGFDPAHFAGLGDRRAARLKLGLSEDKHIVMYTGHLYDWKGAGVLLEACRWASKQVSDISSALFVFVGGTPWDIEAFKKKAQGLSNVLIVGQKPHNEISLYLKSADVLVLPNSAKEGTDRMKKFSQFDTAPIKMFEYMASGVPIIASDLPSIKEILDNRSALFVPPDDPQRIIEGIEKLIDDKEMVSQITQKAKEDAKKYTWKKRGERIIGLIEKTINSE